MANKRVVQEEDRKTGSTTAAGAPALSDRNSLSIGPDGPILLHDVHFLEQMAHFNREKVIERQPHAKGSGAFGVFETTEDVSAYTKASLFQKGAATEMLARFSTVAGEQGSPDTWRDVRGFSLKFYTDEGNYDLVGNNTPIFFVRDPMKFPHFIRSQKRLPDSGLRDNHMQWDFWTNNPESAHQVTYLMGERGLPRSWRNMNGYGSHTYMWVNAAGEKFWVKYHFHTQQGMKFFSNAEASAMAGSDADFHRRDLFEAIARRRFSALDSLGPGDALRRCEDVPDQSVRPHQDLAARRLSADQGRHDDLESQSGEFLRPDRAGRLLAGEHGARHRPVAGQDAAGPRLRLQRCAAQPDRREFPPAAGQPAQGSSQHLHDRRTHGLPPQRRRARLCTQQRRAVAGRIRPAPSTTVGKRTARWYAAPTRSMPTTTTFPNRAPSCARYSTRINAAGWSSRSRAACSAACASRC